MIDAHAGGVALTGAQPEGTLALISGTSNCHMLASQTAIFTPGVWGPYWGAMLPGYWLTEGGKAPRARWLTGRCASITPARRCLPKPRRRNAIRSR
ncbi:FGGY-family pentulose kinase [Enterobacter cancerogenus]|uniref:FGGY-family pentulose kinase n=1 Tax=Enterobacter cancerogenus TaxID=69218 RepID=A0A484XR04_9ENTR|nr:FGGY-family pentulose kinase [Enterobacter cancerogenus]